MPAIEAASDFNKSKSICQVEHMSFSLLPNVKRRLQYSGFVGLKAYTQAGFRLCSFKCLKHLLIEIIFTARERPLLI